VGGGNADDTEPSVGKLGSHVVEFVCPRCARTVAAGFYGPCDDCRGELRAKFVRVERIVEVAEYEPKMNVTPNAVALKED
jgi:hypothetical protein